MRFASITTVLSVAEPTWRPRAADHAARIHSLLSPGFVEATSPGAAIKPAFSALSDRHPVFNFLRSYYNVRGVKGVRALARWAPPQPSRTVLLEGATGDDLAAGTLHRRGASVVPGGVEYSAHSFFNGRPAAAAEPYRWSRALLAHTQAAEPVLHCYGLHEWAMLYQPDGSRLPPSASFQADLPLRVSRATLNAAIERKGTACTHVDALRFFAPAAQGHNQFGDVAPAGAAPGLSPCAGGGCAGGGGGDRGCAGPHEPLRSQQLALEQPGCVHAHMDLLKLALKLGPHVEGGHFDFVSAATLD
jgi:hypothetical protein